MSDRGTVNVYPQHSWHSESEILADAAGLVAMRDAIADAIETGKGESVVFASDGEGYSFRVRRMPDWPAGYGAWADHHPHYTMMDQINCDEAVEGRMAKAEVVRLREALREALSYISDSDYADVPGTSIGQTVAKCRSALQAPAEVPNG